MKDDVHDRLCDNNVDSENYGGLDSDRDRDTEGELETTIRFFPDVLSTIRGPFNHYPIQYLSYSIIGRMYNRRRNLKAVLFIPIFARIALELGCFDEQWRGGLLCRDYCGFNVLQDILCNSHNENDAYNREHLLIEDKHLLVVKQLRQMGYLKKEDIRRHGLLSVCFPRNAIAIFSRVGSNLINTKI
jgi:hypothetical protein